MKKDRHCGMPYGGVPTNNMMSGPMIGGMMPTMGMSNNVMPTTNYQTDNNIFEQINMLNNRVNNLEKKINLLEGGNNYNSGYQMM